MTVCVGRVACQDVWRGTFGQQQRRWPATGNARLLPPLKDAVLMILRIADALATATPERGIRFGEIRIRLLLVGVARREIRYEDRADHSQ